MHVSSALFLMNIFVNLNKGFYFEGIIVNERTKIFKSYLPFQFAIDFLIFIAVILDEKNLLAIILTKILSISTLYNRIDEHF